MYVEYGPFIEDAYQKFQEWSHFEELECFM
jgi:hypothetical protein